MARGVLERTVIDNFGNAIVGADVTVYLAGTETLADLFDAQVGGSAVANPSPTIARGLFQVYVENGEYDLNIDTPGTDLVLTDVRVFDADALAAQVASDAADVAAALAGIDDISADVAQVAADRVQTGLDAAATAADAISTAADAVSTSADAAATAADAIATAADAASTGADVTTTAANAASASADASAASASATAASDSEDLAQEWAENPEDVAITGNAGKFSALHHSAKAEAEKDLAEAAATAAAADAASTAADVTSASASASAASASAAAASTSADESAASAASAVGYDGFYATKADFTAAESGLADGFYTVFVDEDEGDAETVYEVVSGVGTLVLVRGSGSGAIGVADRLDALQTIRSEPITEILPRDNASATGLTIVNSARVVRDIDGAYTEISANSIQVDYTEDGEAFLPIYATYSADILDSRDWTTGNWTTSSMTAALTATDSAGNANACTLLTSTAANGFIEQVLTHTAADRIASVLIERVTGTGTVEVSLDGSTYTDITSQVTLREWVMIEIPTQNLANSRLRLRLGTSGDAVNVDFAHSESGTQLHRPRDTAGSAIVSVNSVADTTDGLPASGTIICEVRFLGVQSSGASNFDEVIWSYGSGANRISLDRDAALDIIRMDGATTIGSGVSFPDDSRVRIVVSFNAAAQVYVAMNGIDYGLIGTFTLPAVGTIAKIGTFSGATRNSNFKLAEHTVTKKFYDSSQRAAASYIPD